MRRPLNNYTRITSVHGQLTNMGKFGRHLGNDYSVPVGNTVYAPVSGKITFSGSSATLGQYYEFVENGNGRIHRLCHLSSRSKGVGAQITEGEVIGKSGNTGITTGAHLHFDIRKPNTAWDASFSNYYNPEALLAEANKPAPSMPAVGALVKLSPPQVRTTFRAGSTTVAGKINVTDNTFNYIVRGYDPNYPGRIIINSASAGGSGVALALYYTNGNKIEGWSI